MGANDGNLGLALPQKRSSTLQRVGMSPEHIFAVFICARIVIRCVSESEKALESSKERLIHMNLTRNRHRGTDIVAIAYTDE